MVWDETKSTKLCNTQIYMPVYLRTEITWKHKWQRITRTVGLGGVACALNPRTWRQRQVDLSESEDSLIAYSYRPDRAFIVGYVCAYVGEEKR